MYVKVGAIGATPRVCFGGCGGGQARRGGVGHSAGAVHSCGGCILTAEWILQVPGQHISSLVLHLWIPKLEEPCGDKDSGGGNT